MGDALIKVYLSSTFVDLKEYREAVYRQLRKLRTDTISMEDYVASEKRPLAKCLEDVAAADVYVGIFAWRYGYIPKDPANPDSRSITELEYEAAGQKEIERLIFILDEDADWKPPLMDSHTGEGDRGQRILQLREELMTRHSVITFRTPDELAKEVSASVYDVVMRRLSEKEDVARRETPPPRVSYRSTASPQGDSFHLTRASYQAGEQAAQSVGRLEYFLGSGYATGFLVAGDSLHEKFGPNLFLITTAHILSREGNAAVGAATIDQVQLRLTAPEESSTPIKLSEVVWVSPVDALDVSLTRLERQPVGVSGLKIAPRLPVVPDTPPAPQVFLIGHPLGGPLTYSLGGTLVDRNDSHVLYTAKTAPGSSGSPVFNDSWQVLGIHRKKGEIPRLSGAGKVFACEAICLLAVREALKREYG